MSTQVLCSFFNWVFFWCWIVWVFILSIFVVNPLLNIFLKLVNLFYLEADQFTILWWFCRTLTWIGHGCTCVPHLEPNSHLSPHPIHLGCPSALALSALFHALSLDWSSISHMVIYMFQCCSLKSCHPCLLPQSPKVCSLYLCLLCGLAYRVIITIFLNSICMQ